MTRRVGGNQINDERDPYDDYPTDPAWTRLLLDEVEFVGEIWEPACGSGWMADVLSDAGHKVHRSCIQSGQDFLLSERAADNIVTNPPYRHADAFIKHALRLATRKVAMLLPVGSLGGQRRARDVWLVRPPALIIMIPTRMVVHGVASQFNHVWAVWDIDHAGPTVLRWRNVDPSETIKRKRVT